MCDGFLRKCKRLFQGAWQNAFADYLVTRHIEGCHWSINPESGDTAGWYGHAYDPITNTAGWVSGARSIREKRTVEQTPDGERAGAWRRTWAAATVAALRSRLGAVGAA